MSNDSLFQRFLNIFGVQRQYGQIESKPTTVKHGASYAQSYGTKPTFNQLNALAAFAAHPYVFAALSRISQDLAATPIKLIKGVGSNSQIIDDHPVLDLLGQPSSDTDQFSFLEQLIIDLVACGNCYVLLLGLRDTPESVVRLHPEEVEIVTDQTGITGYRFISDGSSVIYPPNRIIHTKNASWMKGSRGLYGVGGIEPLAAEIRADLNISKLTSQASDKGRPDAIISPKTETDIWDYETRRQILDQYAGLAQSGGALVLSGMVDVQFTQLTPREMEYTAARTIAKQSITAAFAVPESVLGANSANYATARQQAISYWSTLAKRGKRIAHLLTLIAQKFDTDLRVEFDYSGVEALNSMRTEQLQRVQLHIANGMSPADAYAYEGLDDAPIIGASRREPEAEEIGDEEDESARSFLLTLADAVQRADDNDELAKYGSLQEAFDALSEAIQLALTRKAAEHNEQVDNDPAKRTTKLKLGAVFWRGIGAYKTNPESVRPSVNNADQWAYGRVNSFLYALRNGRFRSGKHDQDLLPKDHPMSNKDDKHFIDVIERGSVGDVDPSNFPEDGEDSVVSLSTSNHPVFDPEYAADLKANHPKIWKAGGNIEGNNQYRRLKPITERRDKSAQTETEELAIRKREAWIARHFEDGAQFEDEDLSPTLSNVAGIVAQIKWFTVGALGEAKMKSVLNELKIKLQERARARRVERWHMWQKSRHEPAEKMLKKAATAYFKGAVKRYQSRIRKHVDTRSLTRGIISFDELSAMDEERRLIFNQIGGAWQRIWVLTGNAELERAYQLARLQRPLDLVFEDRTVAVDMIEQLADQMSRTTAEAVQRAVQNGLDGGASIEQIAEEIQSIAAFSVNRSTLIARTEATRSVNAASVQAYQQAAANGINIKKEWITSADDKAREAHLELDGEVIGVNELFTAENPDGSFAQGSGPGEFGEAAQDCNCRCAIAPKVIRSTQVKQ